MKNGLENHANERDSKGRLTALALAIDALRDAECDCGHRDPPCLACMCEAAIGGAVRERNEARAKLAKVRQELAATAECDCGRCAACRIADAIGGVP